MPTWPAAVTHWLPLSSLHQPPQSTAEEELAPLERVLLVLWGGQRLAASELTGHGAAVIVAVGVLQVAPCAEQRSVQLQHGTARPAAHQGHCYGRAEGHIHTHRRHLMNRVGERWGQKASGAHG